MPLNVNAELNGTDPKYKTQWDRAGAIFERVVNWAKTQPGWSNSQWPLGLIDSYPVSGAGGANVGQLFDAYPARSVFGRNTAGPADGPHELGHALGDMKQFGPVLPRVGARQGSEHRGSLAAR